MMCAKRFLSSPRLRAQIIRRTGRRLSMHTITQCLLAAEYHSCRPARYPRLTLVFCWCRHQWAIRHRVWDVRHWRECLHWRVKLYHRDGRVQVRGRQGERPIDVYVQGIDGKVGPSIIIWAGFWWAAPWTSRCTGVWCNKVSYPRQELPSWITLYSSKIMIRPTHLNHKWFCWKTRTWKSWIGHPKVWTWTPLNTSGTRWQFISLTCIIRQLKQHICLWLCSRPGLP